MIRLILILLAAGSTSFAQNEQCSYDEVFLFNHAKTPVSVRAFGSDDNRRVVQNSRVINAAGNIFGFGAAILSKGSMGDLDWDSSRSVHTTTHERGIEVLVSGSVVARYKVGDYKQTLLRGTDDMDDVNKKVAEINTWLLQQGAAKVIFNKTLGRFIGDSPANRTAHDLRGKSTYACAYLNENTRYSYTIGSGGYR